jgi:predicted phage terminase large subunit-like protein
MVLTPTPSDSSESDWLDPFVASLSPAEQQAILTELESQWIPLPHQVAPNPPWDLWLLAGGRGSGKTDADAYYVDEHAKGPACIAGPAPHRIGIIAPTHDDAKKTCVVGDSGLRSHNPDIRFVPGGKDADLIWPNGAVANLFGAFTPEDVERLRGPQHCLLWCEELAAWRYLEECWDQAQFGLRLGPHPHAVASSTPKPRKAFMELMKADTTALAHATTDDNPYLQERVRSELYRRYAGTRLGRQELMAEILDDMPGALVKRDQIQYGQAPRRYDSHQELVPDYTRIVVAIDPAGTYGPDSDETGIVVCGARESLGFVIDDLSGRFSPGEWAKRAIKAYDDHQADAIVVERNYGGDMVRHTLQSEGFTGHVIEVVASRGKTLRAEPVTAKYEQGLIYHVRPFPELEDQLCTYTPDTKESPDRMDALVWAFTELMIGPVYEGSVSMIA